MQPARRALALTKAATPSVCRGCISPWASRRTLTTAAAPAGTGSLPTGPAPSGIAPLASRKLISVSGPDAAKYLQGVITANLLTGQTPSSQTVRPDQGFPAAFLTAQGRVLHDVFIYRDTANLSDLSTPSPSTTFLIEVDSAEADRLQRHIKRYKLRANFTVRLLPSASVFHFWDDASPSLSQSILSSLSPSTIHLPDTRLPSLGHRLLVPSSTTPSIDLPAVSEETYTLRRYLHGIPEGQSEILRESALPLESNLDLMRAVDFRKGCYVGQELTIRTKHRGVVRKRILPVVLYGAGTEAPRELEYRPGIATAEGIVDAGMANAETEIGRVGRKGRSAGKWLRGMGNVGLALCRLEIMTGWGVEGEGSGGWKEGDEFSLRLGQGEGEEGDVRIKAFVPEWMRRGLKGEGEGARD